MLALAEGGYSVELRAIIAILSWGGVLIGLVLGRLPRAPIPDAALICGVLLGGLAILTLGSASWASDNGAAVDAFLLVSAYLGIFTLAVCLSGGDARPWLVGLALGIVAVAAIALLGRLIPDLPGGDEEIREFLPAARGRLSYPIGYWNAIAALLALGVVLLVWLSAAAVTLAGRALAVASIPMLGLAMYLTSSRGGFAALLIGLVALVALGPRRPLLLAGAVIGGVGTALAVLLASGHTELLDDAVGSEAEAQGLELLAALIACMFFAGTIRTVFDGALSRLSVSPAVARGSMAAAGILAIAAAVAVSPGERLEEFKRPPAMVAGDDDFVEAHLASGSGSGRWQFWGEALDAFASEPVVGIGAGGYGYYWNQHAPIPQVTGHAHSLYLEQLATLGLLGALLIVSALAIAVVRGISRRRGLAMGEAGAAVALVATGAVSAGIDWTWEIPAAFGPVVLVLAVLTGPAVAPAGREPSDGPRRFGLGIAVILAGWAIIFLAFASLLAARNLDASREAVRDGDLERAAAKARAAIAIQGSAAEPRLQLALVQERAGDLHGAAASLDAAIDRASEDWRLWLVRARLATLQGELPEARAALAEARRLNPRSTVLAPPGTVGFR